MSCGRLFSHVQLETFDGCVYILSNPSMPGLLKIGMTEQDAFERARDLSSATGVPEPYVVEAYVTCDDPSSNESAIHQELSSIRKPNREFFAISLAEALGILERVTGKRPDFRRQEDSQRQSDFQRQSDLAEAMDGVYNWNELQQPPRDAWTPLETPSAQKSPRTRASSANGRGPVKFKISCPGCGQEHWFPVGERPSTCSACGRSLQRSAT
jgi:hypothetical protein